MLNFVKNNFGYILGVLLTPITWKIFKTLKRTFKRKYDKKCTPKNDCSSNYSKIIVTNKEK